MNPTQIRARLGEIRTSLQNFENLESFTAEQLTEIKSLQDEFTKLTGQLEAHEALAAMKGKLDAAPRVVPAAPETTQNRIEVVRDHDARFRGFKTAGDFFMAVKRSAMTGNVDQKLQASIAYEKNGEDGGFLVPDEINMDIQKKLESSESLLGRTREFRTGGNNLAINIDEDQPWNGGVRAYWIEEGGTYTATKPKFRQAQWRLHKLGALVQPTDELLEDATGLESYIRTLAPEAIMHAINSAIISGNGAGKPSGLLASTMRYTVAKENMQTADTINSKNVLKMYARMLPAALAGAVWLVNAGCIEQLLMLKDDNDNYICLAPGSQMNQSPYTTLLGKPVLPMLGAMPALGDEGDIIFVNLQYYWSLLKSTGVKQAVSTHLYFDRDITAFKFTMRIDGKVPFLSPVATENGNFQMSPIVTLEAR